MQHNRGKGMGSRLWRHNICSTYLLLLAVTLMGSYIILFNGSFEQKKSSVNVNIDKLMADIDNTKDRIFEVKYEPVFAKYYSKYYSNKSNTQKKEAKSQSSSKNIFSNILNRSETTESELRYNKLWHKADKLITRNGLFPDSDDDVQEILQALSTAKIQAVDVLDMGGEFETGTSEKWILTLEGGQKAVLKLMWEDKGKPKPGGLCNYGYEMPWAEIVGFHVHKVLGFMNTPYVSGRKVDIRKEILPVASPRVSKRIQLGTGSETCIIGKCHYCLRENRLCPKDGIVEASVAYWIPRHLQLYTWYPQYMPWSTPNMEVWQTVGFNNKTYCQHVRKDLEPYNLDDEYYYDLFDFAVIDSIIFHYDSKHYIVLDDSDAKGLTIRLDHGRAFCRNDVDEMHIFMAPVLQCCTLRRSTYDKLMSYKRTELFSRKLKSSLSKDKLAPFLDSNWYTAFERRLNFIFTSIEKCTKANAGLENILV